MGQAQVLGTRADGRQGDQRSSVPLGKAPTAPRRKLKPKLTLRLARHKQLAGRKGEGDPETGPESPHPLRRGGHFERRVLRTAPRRAWPAEGGGEKPAGRGGAVPAALIGQCFSESDQAPPPPCLAPPRVPGALCAALRSGVSQEQSKPLGVCAGRPRSGLFLLNPEKLRCYPGAARGRRGARWALPSAPALCRARPRAPARQARACRECVCAEPVAAPAPAGGSSLGGRAMGEAEVGGGGAAGDKGPGEAATSPAEETVVWSPEVEVCLFHAMLGHKPVGEPSAARGRGPAWGRPQPSPSADLLLHLPPTTRPPTAAPPTPPTHPC